MFRPWFVLVAGAMFALGFAILGSLHAARITCTRIGDEPGSCHVRRYALVGSVDVTLSPNEVASVDVRVRSSSKGAKYAVVRVVTTSGYGTIELESGTWGYVSPERAEAVAARFDAFKQQRLSSLDEWLTIGVLGYSVILVLGIAICGVGYATLREQLAQRRPIRIVVNHVRESVIVGTREIPFAEIADVKVGPGTAHFGWSMRHEHVMGHRLVLVCHSGDEVPVTEEFRAGDRDVHDGARSALLFAMGRMAPMPAFAYPLRTRG